MATIQIRDVPESAYETIRRRARAAGQSIQAYMRGQVIELASRPTKAEAVAAIDGALARHGGSTATPEEIADDVAADRR
jgi:antitoxin FitA